MGPDSVRNHVFALLAVAACGVSFSVHANGGECTVRFFQDDKEVVPSAVRTWQMVPLRKASFVLSITPASCSYLVATLVDLPLIVEAEQFTPLIFAGTGTAMAGYPEDADILHWPSRSPIRTTLKEQSQDWRTLDTYKREAAALGYEPQVVMAWGSAFPLQKGDDRATAQFHRLTKSIRLDDGMPDIDLPGVIYLRRKELDKPSWEGAGAPWLLLEPYRVIYRFR